MLQVVLAISGLKSRLPVTLKLDVARAPEIRVGIGFGQQARVIAVVTGAALVKRGVLQQKVNR